ncbi:MAG: hypothetical protein F6J92_40425 [Symploca sp. SIO1A3]|nr:hypothetical protein [Symploca sp. SIO1A3]
MNSLPESINLKIVGDRSAGKTTYMAALARWPHANSSSLVQSVTSFNEDGQQLIAQAQNILEQGLILEPTRLGKAASLPDYGLRIVLKGKRSQEIILTINCKDYSGEFFSDLLYRQQDSLLQEYLEDCAEGNGIMFLLDGIAYRKDAEYARGIGKFLEAIGQLDAEKPQRRLALVLTKCEQPDLWIKRHQPQELVKARFPQAYSKLKNWQSLGKLNIEYFTTSAFGMLGASARQPNARKIKRDREGVASVIKEPRFWQPFGLVAPIYWLYTGQRHQGLEED